MCKIIKLNQFILHKVCANCGKPFSEVRGSIYEDGSPLGLYIIALHGICSSNIIAHLSITLINRQNRTVLPSAAALLITATPSQSSFSFIDWKETPWKNEGYIGELLDREKALRSSQKTNFLHVAEHVISDIPIVKEYMDRSCQ